MDIKEAKEICRKEITNTYAEGKAKAIETVLSELDKKDKIIDEMAQSLIDAPIRVMKGDVFTFTNKPDTISYFTKKVEG